MRKFLGTFIFIIGLIMIISIVFDASEKMDDLVSSGASVHEIIFDYYINFMIHYSNMLGAFFVFIAVITFTSKLAQNSEIVAILSSGVSFNRFLRPYVITATLLVGVSFYFNQTLVPNANKTRLRFERKYFHNEIQVNHFYKERNSSSIYCENYYADEHMARNITVQKWNGDILLYQLIADEARWDSISKQWTLIKYYERILGAFKDTIIRGRQKVMKLDLNPEEFEQEPSIIDAMNGAELNAFIANEQQKGSDKIQDYLVKKYEHTAFPFATYILTIIGVAVSSRKQKGGIGIHLAAGVLLTMFYFFFQRMATVAATNIGTNAFIAVWIPNIIFMVLAYILYRRAPK